MNLTQINKLSKICISAVLCLSSLTQNALADANAAAAAPQAGAPKPQTNILKNYLTQTPAKPSYNVTLSEGPNPEDFDIMITRRVGKVYSFKYCKAYNADGSPTEVFSIRRLRFETPNILSDAKTSSVILSQFFDSPNCDFFTRSKVYAVREQYDVGQKTSNTGTDTAWTTIGTGIAGIASVGVSANILSEIRELKRQNNTLSLRKLFFSSRYPWFQTAFVIAAVGAGVKGAFLVPKLSHENYSIDAVANSTYVHAAYADSIGTEDKASSMKEFMSDFISGLDLMTKNSYFVAL
jgi:hypothetical protein